MRASRGKSQRRQPLAKRISSLGHEDTLLDRNRGRLCPVAHFQLCDNMPDVVADGEVADLDCAADLLIS